MKRTGGFIAVVSLLCAAGGSAVFGQVEPQAVPTPSGPPRVDVVPRRGLPGRDVALLVSGQQGGQISVSVKVFPPASAGKADRVPWVADIPGVTLAAMAQGGALDLDLAVYLQKKGGEIVGHGEYTLHVSGVPASWQTGGGLKVLGYVDAAFPPAVLRVLVRELSAGAFGNWEMPVPVRAGSTPRSVTFDSGSAGDAGSLRGGSSAGGSGGSGFAAGSDAMTGRAGLLALVAPDPPEPWLVVGVGGARSDAGDAPFSLAGSGALPATRPVVRPGAVVRLALLGEGLPGMLEAVARVVYSDGRPPVACPARIVGRLPAPGGPFEQLTVAVNLPPEIPPGEHDLTVTCRALGGLDVGTVGTFFRVAPPERAGTATSWPAVLTDETGRLAAPAKASAGIRPVDEEAPANVKAAYRDAVARYAADGSGESLRALVGFERTTLSGGSPGELGRLASAERSFARTAAKASPAALLGLCLVHVDVYQEHSRDSAYLAIGHSRRIVEEMTEILAAEPKDKDARRAAAGVLTVFASELLSVGSYATAERLFVRAAALDPDDIAALMGRAGILERVGDFKHAIGGFESVLARRPDHAEARLRLGVNLRRVGHDGAAREALRSCVAESRPAWVRAVAWQELAAMELERGRPGEALRVLREATTALPADQALQVLLASTLDRERRHREALAVVDAIIAAPEAETASARLLYSQPPRDDLDAVRARLEAERPACLAALAAAGKEARP